MIANCSKDHHLIVYPILDMTTVTERDIREVTDELEPDELQHLFHSLNIPKRDIEHAERSADTPDTRLKARAVLSWWRKTKGKDATREALIEAKKNCIVSMEAEVICQT